MCIEFNITSCDDGDHYECYVLAQPSNDTGSHQLLLEVEKCEYTEERERRERERERGERERRKERVREEEREMEWEERERPSMPPVNPASCLSWNVSQFQFLFMKCLVFVLHQYLILSACPIPVTIIFDPASPVPLGITKFRCDFNISKTFVCRCAIRSFSS